MHNSVLSLNDIFLYTYHHKYYLETPTLDNKAAFLQFAQPVFFRIHIVKTQLGVRCLSSSASPPPPLPPPPPPLPIGLFEIRCPQITALLSFNDSYCGMVLLQVKCLRICNNQ